MIILLPPSEGKLPDGKGAWKPASGKYGKTLEVARREVINALRNTPPQSLKVRGATADHAVAINAQLIGAPVRPAFERYNGVVFQGLDFASLEREAREIALKTICIVSGLTGLSSLGDMVPDYRAPIDSSLNQLGKLSLFWRAHLESALGKLASRHVIVDLLPQAHRHAAVPTPSNWLKVNLVHKDGLGGHAAKHAKGELTRWLLTHDVSELEKWRSSGWSVTVG